MLASGAVPRRFPFVFLVLSFGGGVELEVFLTSAPLGGGEVRGTGDGTELPPPQAGRGNRPVEAYKDRTYVRSTAC